MVIKNSVRSCMIGDSIFKIGDYTSLAQGWSLYRDRLSLEECLSLKIIDLIYIMNEDLALPKFVAKVETNKGNILDINVEDLNDVRNIKENREELNKVGYDFETGCIYCKGYEKLNGKWEFFQVGIPQYAKC
ncbi:hypothetical protein [Clostridium rectalis]|uniref:hypothetical protein n=1 Tax=Clostridium rectalis TaxID=2040295 RepID=UPI000F63F524|nr:hypothetical protein [Clostridium rectalis]